MSHVTSVLLYPGPDGADQVELLNERVADHFGRPEGALTLLDVSPHSGGWKHPERIFYGGFNGLDLDAYMRLISETPWPDPELVQVLVCRENDEVFTVYRLTDRSLDGGSPSTGESLG